MESSKINIKEYTNLCKTLRHELSQVIYDRQESGLKTYYAVDFSEIYAYVFREKTAHEFVIFKDLPIGISMALQQKSLHTLFHREPKCVVFPSYIQEWDELLTHLSREEIRSIHQNEYQIVEELKYLTEIDEFKNLVNKIQKMEKFKPEDVDSLLNFLVKNSASLVRVFFQKSKPIERLKLLASDSLFQDFETFINSIDADFQVIENKESILRKYERFLTLRNNNSNKSCYLDSVALDTLDQVNNLLRNYGSRLILVTRSDSMQKTFELEHPELISSHSMIRHPRTFIDFYQHSTVDKLQQHLKTVSSFIESSRKAISRHKLFDIEYDQILRNDYEQLTQIRQSWIKASAVSETTKSEDNTNSDFVDLVIQRPDQDSVSRLLEFIRNNESICHKLDLKVESLEDEWKKAHQNMGVSLQAKTIDNIDDYDIKVFSTKRKHHLLGTTTSSIYSLHFYTKEAQEFIEKYSSNITVNWRQIINSYNIDSTISSEADYERLLAMSFVLGNFGEWELAKRYCDLAINTFKKSNNVTPSEAFYFLAICSRKVESSLEAYANGIENINEAIKLKKTLIKTDDPRYILERGTQILSLNILLSSHPNIDATNKYPYPPEGLIDLELADSLAKSGTKLKAQILNNRLYFSTELGTLHKKREETLGFISELYKLSDELFTEKSNYPPLFLDTLVWSYWVLNQNSSDRNWMYDKEWVSSLNCLRMSMYKHGDLSEHELKLIENHIENILQMR